MMAEKRCGNCPKPKKYSVRQMTGPAKPPVVLTPGWTVVQRVSGEEVDVVRGCNTKFFYGRWPLRHPFPIREKDADCDGLERFDNGLQDMRRESAGDNGQNDLSQRPGESEVRGGEGGDADRSE